MADVGVLSFKDWCRSNPSIPFSQKQQGYKTYLETTLITSVESNDTAVTNPLKECYKGFLRRLTVIYQDDPEVRRLNNIDLDDPKQLISAIPIFSNKIKDISELYKRPRGNLKNQEERIFLERK